MFDKLIIKWFSATLQKNGNQISENEDKYAPTLSNGAYFHTKEFRCAISDGATESSFSQIWADHLVNEYINAKFHDSSGFIADAKRKWNGDVSRIEHTWASQEKIKNGSFATLVGFNINADDRENIYPLGGKWKAIGIGDSCLFQFREEKSIQIIPIQNLSDFHNRPALLGTGLATEKYSENIFYGYWKSGDDFFLMTDALAEWAISNMRFGKNVSGILKDKLTRKSRENLFSEWINTLRFRHEIKNDDTTVIWVKVY
jgi:hypothetical protein